VEDEQAEENAAPVCRFVPEAMRDADTGPLITQQRYGTIDRPGTWASSFSPGTMPETLVCGAIGGQHNEVFVEQAGSSDVLRQSADALGSPSYNQPPVSRAV
jgi:hypothetical protein